MAVPFDPAQLRLAAAPVPAVEGILQSGQSGVAYYSVADDGSLAYIPGHVRGANSTFVWVDRQGTKQPLAAPPHAYRNPRISPDGRRVAMGIDELGGQVWIYDLSRGALTRLTFEGSGSGNPLWSPDGSRLAFSSGAPGSLFVQPADGSSKAERLTTNEYRQIPNSWSPDGQFLIFHETNPTTSADIMVLPTTRRSPSCKHRPPKARRGSHRTGAGWRIPPLNPAGRKSTSSHFLGRAGNGRFPPKAEPSRSGIRMGGNCSTGKEKG